MNNIVKFQNKELHTYDFNGLPWLSSVELANGLGYTDDGAVTRIYNRHSDEFTDDMVQVVKLTTRGLDRQIRIFSPRGCHLVAMFARTPFAKAFRKWVLDVLDKNITVPVQVDMKAIGGMIKKCCAVAVREEIVNLLKGSGERTEGWEVSDSDILLYLHRWHLTRNKEDTLKFRQINEDNEKLKRRLLAVKQAVI